MEHPIQGGSYIRQKDGSLVRRVEEPETPAAPARPETKPRTPRTTTKDN